MKQLYKIGLLTLTALLFSMVGYGQVLLEENFDYTVGDLLSAHGWTAHSSGGTQPIDVTTGLSFEGYPSSAIGGAAQLDNTGEDVNRTFTAQTSGVIYASFILQAQSTNSAGYFFSFGQTVIGTTFFSRVWVNATGDGIGVGSSAPATYVPITANTPTLIVVKIDYATKVSSVYAFSTYPESEPATADQTFTETASYSSVGSVALRQYNAAQRQIVDGIRVATSWADLLPSNAPDETAPSFVTNYPNISKITGNGAYLNVQTDEPSTVYGVLLTSNANPPSVAQVKAGTDGLDNEPAIAGSFNVEEANTTFSQRLDQLSAETPYYFYMVAEDPSENIQEATTLVEFTTGALDETAPTFLNGTPSASNILDIQFDLTVQLDEVGSAYYVVVADGASAPTADQVLAGNDNSGGAAISAGMIDVTSASEDFTTTVTGLSATTLYDVYVVALDIQTTPNASDPERVDVTTDQPKDADSNISANIEPLGEALISSLATTSEDAVTVFTFNISDSGSSDQLPTEVTRMVITPGASNTAIWASTIGGAEIYDLQMTLIGTASTITNSAITFDLSGAPFVVQNGESSTVIMLVYLKESVIDESALEFEVPTAHSFTTTSTSSLFAAAVTGATSPSYTVDVDATLLTVQAPEIVFIDTDFTATVKAVDANGNVDKAARTIDLSLATGTGNLSSTSGLTGKSMTDGVYAWADLQLDALGTFTLGATDTQITGGSSAIDVVSFLVLNENFEYGNSDNADITTVSGWTRHSGAQGSAYIAEPLTYSNFDNSAIGGSVRFTNGGSGTNDGDISYPFAPTLSSDGSVYASFLVNLESARSTADYFFHLGPDPVGSTFRARVFAIQSGDKWSVNFGKAGNTTQDNTLLDFNKTYLFVVKYTLSTAGSSDDVVSLYVFDGNVPESSSDAPIVSISDVDGTVADGTTSIGTVAIRQGSNTPTGRIDRIRVATTWEDAIGTYELPTTYITLNSGEFDGTFPPTKVGELSESSAYVVNGTGLTENVTVTAPAGFTVSLDNSTFSTSVQVVHDAGSIQGELVYVRFEPASVQVYEGNLMNASTGANTRLLAVSGTGLSVNTLFYEDFANCPAEGFSTFSVASNRDWTCSSNGKTNGAMVINAFGADVPSEDWLITPVDLSDVANATLSFYSYNAFADATYPPVTFKISTDYAGEGDPNLANWTDVAVTFAPENSSMWTYSGEVDLLDYAGSAFYVAFKYISTGTISGASSEWRIDDFLIEEVQPYFEVISSNFNGDFGQQNVGTTSGATSITLDGFGLTGNVTVTPPAQYQVSTSSTFATVGTSAAPLSIAPVDGFVSNVQVYIRFAPTTGGSANGNVTISTAGFTAVTLAVSGSGKALTLEIPNELGITVYPNPVANSFKVKNESGKPVRLELYTVEGARIPLKASEGNYDISALNSGMYILTIRDNKNNLLGSTRIIKE